MFKSLVKPFICLKALFFGLIDLQCVLIGISKTLWSNSEAMTTPRAGKWDKPITDNTPPVDSKKSRGNDHEVSLICDAIIHEGDNAEDAVYCEGDCQGWLHRRCVCMSKKLYITIGKSNDPFFCPHCKFDAQQKEVDKLRDTVKTLSNELALLKSKDKPSEPFTNVDQTENQQVPSKLPDKAATASKNPNVADRRYNIVIYGIEESSSNISRINRSQSKLEKIVSVLPSVNPTSIKDFHRLGKFKKNQDRPRPIIVKFLRILDAAAVLSNLDKISPPFSVKPDMTPEQRSIESKLLKERFNLIQQSFSRRNIKICNSRLYVSDRLYSEVKNSVFQLSSATSHSSPTVRKPDSPMSDSDSSASRPEVAQPDHGSSQS